MIFWGRFCLLCNEYVFARRKCLLVYQQAELGNAINTLASPCLNFRQWMAGWWQARISMPIEDKKALAMQEMCRWLLELYSMYSSFSCLSVVVVQSKAGIWKCETGTRGKEA